MAESGSDPQFTYLHGDLDLKIIEARQLPNMDVVAQHLRHCFTACGTIKIPNSEYESDGGGRDGDRGKDGEVHQHRKIVTSDPYVKVSVPQATLARTRVIKNSQIPKWNEHFYIPLAHPVIFLEFEVKDDDIFGAESIGTVKFQAEEIASGKLIAGWFDVIGSTGKPPKLGAALRLEMQFTPIEKNPVYRHGIAGDPEHQGVRHTYFPLRRGCSVIPYQDAHVRDGMLPKIELDGGNVYRQEKCWEDICHAIVEAHHMVYIVGWSIYHKVRLIREHTRPLPRGGKLTLGELLKYKSEEGVRVLLLIWDDKTSHDKFLLKSVSLMICIA
jgi:phospholipase D1/2